MYSFRKSKKGFTLIELMVVVAIIGVLALLGLRLYTGQQEKAKNAVVKANCGTIQTLIQADLADMTVAEVTTACAGPLFVASGIRNPYSGAAQVAPAITEGSVNTTVAGNIFTITCYGKGAVLIPNYTLKAQL